MSFLSGFEISRLWKCGNKQLQHRLQTDVTVFRARYGLNTTPKWPTLICHFSNLQQLQLSVDCLKGQSKPRAMLGGDITDVPSSVEVLTFEMGNGFTFCCRPASVTSPLTRRLINMGSAFPNLRELTCTGGLGANNETLEFCASSLPRSLQRLNTEVPLPMDSLQLALLPPTLKALNLSLKTEHEMPIPFPPQLEHLDLSNVASLEVINMLPRGLRNLRLEMRDSDSAKQHNALPPDLIFPPNLERLVASNWPEFPSWIARCLPRSLRRLKYEGNGPLALDLLGRLPRSLTSIDLPHLPLGFSATVDDLSRYSHHLRFVSPELNAILPLGLCFPKLRDRIIGSIDAIDLRAKESTRKSAAAAQRRINRLPRDLHSLYAVICEPQTLSSLAFLTRLKSLRLDLISVDLDYSARLEWLGSLQSLKNLTIASASRLGFIPTAEFRLDALCILNALPDAWDQDIDFDSPSLNGMRELTISFEDNELLHARPKAWRMFCGWLCARADCSGSAWPPNLSKLSVDVVPRTTKTRKYRDDGPESDDEESNLKAALLPSACYASKTKKTSSHHWLPISGLSRLPSTLKSLAFGQLFPFDATALQALPSGLLSLKLGAAACTLKDEDLEHLPPSLDALSLPESPNFKDPAIVLQRVLPHIQQASIKKRLLNIEKPFRDWQQDQLKLPASPRWKPAALRQFM